MGACLSAQPATKWLMCPGLLEAAQAKGHNFLTMKDRINRFTIIGGGSAGWLAASMLMGVLNRRNDGPDVEIELIESPTLPILGVGEATTFSTFQTFSELWIEELDFLKHCDATFKCAVKFSGWDLAQDGSAKSYFHPFDSPPMIYGLNPAYHYLRRQNQGIKQPSFAECMSDAPPLMEACRAPRAFDTPHYNALVNYSFHLDAGLLGNYLKHYCTALGVRYISDDVQDVTHDEKGFIQSLELQRNGTHPVEFVIDCSGFRSLVLRGAMDEEFVPYNDHLLCDRALAVQIPHADGAALQPYTTSTALDSGWSWNVPLQSRMGTGYVFSSAFVSDDEAAAQFKAHLGAAGKDAEPRVIPMSIGRARRSWVKNCLGVGLSAGFVEPLESTSIHLTQVAIRRFLDNLPDRHCAPSLIDRYNRLASSMYEDIRDFISMHYALSNRPGPFWEAARAEQAVPDTVRERLELWRHKLPSVLDIDTLNPLFGEWSYLYVLFGKGFYDGAELPMSDAIADEDFAELIALQEKNHAAIMAKAPDNRAFFNQLAQTETTAWYRPDAAPLPASKTAPVSSIA